MSQVVWILFWLFSGVFAAQFVLSVFFMLRLQRKETTEDKKISGISVVIPYYNEKNRIAGLIQNLNESGKSARPIEIIFVDDCSNDGTDQLLKNDLKIPYSNFTLTKKSGKKTALHTGIEHARYAYILTLDADVKLPIGYFDQLFVLPENDLIILPVLMNGKTFFQKLASLEFGWLQLLTFGSSRPVLCNGANLLFSKKSYFECHASRSDFDLVSGDDVFLMQAMKMNKKKIFRVYDPLLTAETPAPDNIAALFLQRRRWAGKFSRMASPGNTALTLLLALIQITFISSLTLAFFQPIFFVPIALKLIVEFFVCLKMTKTNPALSAILTFFHQFWYPVYLLLLLFPAKADARWDVKKTIPGS